MRRVLLKLPFVALSAVLLVSGEPKADPVNKDGHNVAIKGYDPVAYFKEQRAVKGDPQVTHSWMGAEWRFSSSANRDEFAKSPGKFAPQFGGYCAWAVSNNYTAPVDPTAWKIVDGKLYLNYNQKVQQDWQKELQKRIVLGEKNWPNLHK